MMNRVHYDSVIFDSAFNMAVEKKIDHGSTYIQSSWWLLK